MMSIALSLHLLAAIVWVGGMFFAHMVLRPVVTAQLEPPLRLALMKGVFDRFFPWVWIAVTLLLLTGYWVFLGPMQARAGWHVHLMSAVGLLMVAIYAFIYFRPYRKMAAALAVQQLPEAAAALGLIRKLIMLNLILGLLTSAVAVLGRYHPFI
jgi:uncharacterized membrane protein